MVSPSINPSEGQYVATVDEHGTWRILNTWHEDLRGLGLDDEIPDNHPAVTVLTEGAFIALITTAARIGKIENATLAGVDIVEYERMRDELAQANAERNEMRSRLDVLQSTLDRLGKDQNVATPKSEKFLLRSKAMDSILKVVGMQELGDYDSG